MPCWRACAGRWVSRSLSADRMPNSGRFARRRSAMALAAAASLAGCATTSVSIVPSPQAPVCQPNQSALVLWAPHWRADQKDVPDRERAAEAGTARFLATGHCFASADLKRTATLSQDEIRAHLAAAGKSYDKLIAVRVRELGPVVKLMASAALVEGGTEVGLEITEYRIATTEPTRFFTVHWTHGGPGVVKGIASLPEDMAMALAAGLQAPR